MIKPFVSFAERRVANLFASIGFYPAGILFFHLFVFHIHDNTVRNIFVFLSVVSSKQAFKIGDLTAV